VLPGAPVLPVAPVAPVGPGTATGAGTLTTVGLSQADKLNAANTAESKIEYFMVNPLMVEQRGANGFKSSAVKPVTTLLVVVGT
jgi:hypothetical protein